MNQMKKFWKSRDNERFAVITPQNPSQEVRALSQMISTDQKLTQRTIVAPETTPEEEELNCKDAFTVRRPCEVSVHEEGRGFSRAANRLRQTASAAEAMVVGAVSPSRIAAHSQISNRQCLRLETPATHSKQTTAPRSNRHFFSYAAPKIHANSKSSGLEIPRDIHKNNFLISLQQQKSLQNLSAIVL